MSAHTPGPWALDRHGVIRGGKPIEYVNGASIPQVALATGNDGISDDERLANAERIVACVNACEGLTTEELRLFAMLPDGLAGTVARVTAQRDELLAALRAVLEWTDPFALPNCERNEADVDRARAAIARAEGRAHD